MKTILLLSLIIVFIVLSCTNPFSESRSSNCAILTGYVYKDQHYSVPASNVQVTLTRDPKGSKPFTNGDISVFTDKSGKYEITAFLGSQVDTIGNFTTTYFADVLLVFYKQKSANDSTGESATDLWIYNSFYGDIRIVPNKTFLMHNVSLYEMGDSL
jgi:hypothetical protein